MSSNIIEEENELHSNEPLNTKQIGEESPDTFFTLFKKVLPLLLALIIVAFLFIFFKNGCVNKPSEHITAIDTAIVNVDTAVIASPLDSLALAATQKWESTLGKMKEYTLPNGTKISIPEHGFENKFFTFMKDGTGDMKNTWFELDRILFNSGGAELNAISMTQIKTVAEILKAYPSTKIKIGGYTDNSGSLEGNVKLSGERAAMVLSQLTKMGIATDRLESEGYGPKHPVCVANDTEECKSKNRRVAFRVSSK